ncbi:inverse autotransporter beta domain-containing protein [Xenorhabdus lircayensis]|uniref:Inverse autotransporter beta domain-containing protein n=1 Tax=Xenorhabdus lircayensis TaxID=2763499 RepID=A0ABS0U5Z5_9GAMM|nr:inverse autotransporter beta domain-containing protein [Xenorhabdus lircayensis]MBI6549302.1 inverse autotransporter beta domain-containing protein [Xenorhabdus lircayensis]
MDLYISHKVIRLSVLVYSLFLPFTPMSAFSVGEKAHDNKTERKFLQKSESENNTNNVEDDKAGIIAKNIHKVGNMLSSSPSQLTEQAKSYALGKINNTISTETQKWLSQFGTARINFSLDRKGKLDNGSLDLLLPLYDNKTDWLFFSQLGYRNKDSRHTLNLGLGGRYFTPSWMYGLNTFFDHDVTGKNKRLGLGGEAWTDYVKLSANTYWRLSNWHQSPKERDYEERPANGFDLNSEFFLPAYPNLGGKLSYEQYFGDNVALFNRDTKQKDPSLARFGLNYTPIPLVTMGVDYKLGSGGSSETLFQANLNYRFGTPFDAQISPDNVASMRTLAGSRYDLVERNNNIVLDYKKKQELTITLPDTLSGHGSQSVRVDAKITSDKPLREVNWKASKGFRENGGIISNNDSYAELVLPKYVNKGTNRYTLFATAEEKEGGNPKTAQMSVVVEPFIIKDQSIEPNGKGPVIADGNSFYNLAATITYGNKDNAPLPGNRAIPGVNWSIEPSNSNAKLLWEPSGTTNDQGQLTATLSSTTPLSKDTKVYLTMDGMDKMEIKSDTPLTFTSVNSKYQITQQQIEPTAPLSIHDKDNSYIFTATILGQDGKPLENQKIEANWTATPNDGVELKPSGGTNNTTNDQGQLSATLKITKIKAQDITVTLSIVDGPNEVFKPVKFVDDANESIKIKEIKLESPGPYPATGNKFKVKAQLIKQSGTYVKNEPVKLKWTTVTEPAGLQGFHIEPSGSTTATPDNKGWVTAYFTSTQAVKNAKIGLLLVEENLEALSDAFDFIAPTPAVLNASLGEITPPTGSLIGDGETKYPFKVKVIGTGGTNPMPYQSLSGVTWSIKDNKLPDNVKIHAPENPTTDADGYLTASLTSNVGTVDAVIVQVSLDGAPGKQSAPVNFEAVEQLAGMRMTTKGTSNSKDIPSTQQERPYNVHTELVVTLLTPEENKEILLGGPHDVKIESSNTNIAKVDDKGRITFPLETFDIGQGPTKVTASVTNKGTGKKSTYVYTFNPQIYVFLPTTDKSHVGGVLDRTFECKSLDPKYTYNRDAITLTLQDIGATDTYLTENSYSYEYDKVHFPDFGVLATPNSDNPYLKVWSYDTKHGEAYDYRKRELLPFDEVKEVDVNTETKVKLICKLRFEE